MSSASVFHVTFAALQVPGGFSAGAMETNSLNSFSTKRRNRRGTTSPPLVNIHPNPGPHQKKGRKTAKTRLDHHLGSDELKQVQQLVDENVPTAEISRRLQLQEKTATRWTRRYTHTGVMEREKQPGRPSRKRFRHDKENLTSQHPPPRR
jgi:hypothetical protein